MQGLTPARLAAAFIAAAFLAAILPARAPTAAESPEGGERYRACMRLALSQPEAGRQAAAEWRLGGGGNAARHCAAAALQALGRYDEAAERLERLARDMGNATPEIVVVIWRQAGQAWSQAGEGARARAAFDAAVALKPEDARLRVERGLAMALAEQYDDAIVDFSAALVAEPDNVEARVFRASAYLRKGRPEPAAIDLDRALARAPDHPDALLERGLLRYARGDDAGARDDWLQVLDVAPDSAAAQLARRRLGAMAPRE